MSTTRAYAVSALEGYQKTRRGSAEVDPTDEKQINLFISLKDNLGDKERMSVALFLKWLRDAKDELEASGSQALRALAVPKANFPRGLPENLIQAELSEEDLAEYRKASMDAAQLDLENFYILDFFSVKDKSVLGKKVRELSFRNSSSKRLKLGARPAPGSAAFDLPGGDSAASSAAVPPGGPPPPTSPAATSPDAPCLAPRSPTVGAGAGLGSRREVKRNSSDPFVADAENKEVKRARLQKDVILALKDKIKTAAEAGRWTSHSKLCVDSVDFLMGELVETMKEIKRDQPNAAADGLTAVMTRVCAFAANLFLNHGSYKSLPPFSKTFDAFEELGAEVAGLPLLVRELAKIGLESDALPALTGAGAADRMTFRESPCYKSFLAFRFQRDLDRAKAAAGLDQIKALKEIVEATADDVAPDVYKQATTALQALDPKLPLAARVQWALADDFALAVVHEWAPDSDLSRAVTLAGPAPPLEDMTYVAFEKTCRLLMGAGIEPQNPLVEEACSFLAALQEVPAWRQPNALAWFELLERLAFSERLGLAEEDEEAGKDDEADLALGMAALPREDLGAVVVAAKAFVKPKGKKGKMPEWLKGLAAAADAAEEPVDAPVSAAEGLVACSPVGGLQTPPAGEPPLAPIGDKPAAGDAVASSPATGESAPAGGVAENQVAGVEWSGLWKEIEESEEGQRGILADIYYPKVKGLFVEVWCRTVTASGGLAGLRTTLDMVQKRDRAEDELTKALVGLLDHGLDGETLASWVDEQEYHEVFAKWVSVATALSKRASLSATSGSTLAGKADAAPAATDGNGAAGGASTFKKGDVVVGIATKHKEDWNGHRCEIIEVLSSHYKVCMLEGPQKGEKHKYLHKSVKAAQHKQQTLAVTTRPDGDPSQPSANDSSKQQPGAGVASKSAQLQDLASLFDC